MINYIALAVALALSVCSAYFSIMGLATIFAAAKIQVLVMGSIIEAAKVVAISWSYRNWDVAPRLIKYYLVVAIVILMAITSMGTFGYLSKAHQDQAIPVGDVVAQLTIIDQKIQVSKDNIEAGRKALAQMDQAVDQIMARSTDETGADKAVRTRRAQQKERRKILAEIETEQRSIAALNQERAPIASEVRKVEAEVGPIRYIAKLMYGSDPDGLMLEQAVIWVIIMIVVVFDPLAVVLLLAGNFGLNHNRVQDLPVMRPRAVKQAEPKPKLTDRAPKWVQKTSQLIQKRKKGTIEIDKSAVMKMK
jgi:hypothetical protein